jgi:transglutaminase-like putative cysteine protease
MGISNQVSLRFSHSFRFSRADLRDVLIRIPIAAEHYAKDLECFSDHPLKIFNAKGNIFGQINLSPLPSRIVRWNIDVSVKMSETKNLGQNWGRLDEYQRADLQRYCNASQYWEVRTEVIQRAARKIRAESSEDIYDLAGKTFSFVRQSIKSPEPQEKRFGALRALVGGFGDCDEFSDLFIAILRSLNVPARRITGIFINNQQAEPHAWAEILLPTNPPRWLTMDPALGFFAHRTCHHFGRKIEGTLSARNDVQVQWKGKKKAQVQIEVEIPQLLEAD